MLGPATDVPKGLSPDSLCQCWSAAQDLATCLCSIIHDSLHPLLMDALQYAGHSVLIDVGILQADVSGIGDDSISDAARASGAWEGSLGVNGTCHIPTAQGHGAQVQAASGTGPGGQAMGLEASLGKL